MLHEARTDAGAPAYRGFLFSDVRGFTAFAERYGNTAAAEMVGRFLELARKAIARHDGAEIKTEGDNIHAVFPSASSAVLCGMDIVDAAAELNAREPQRPLRLGVGVHAGEAVETAEGYIGRAVNIAARLCAAARPGEVLVSSTVKGITQASIPVGFIPRGRRHLKGIQDPILVYAVTRDTSATAPRDVPRSLVLGAGVVVVVVVAITVAIATTGGQFLAKLGPSPDASPVATAARTAQPVVIGPLPIGTYASQAFQPSVSFDIVDLGWTANRDLADMLSLVREAAPRGSVYFLRVQEVIEDPCIQGGDQGALTGPGPADLLTGLEALLHLTVSDRQAVRIGGFAGQQVDITVADGALAACGGLVGAGVALFTAGDQVWSATPGERFRLISVDVRDQAVTLLVSTDWTETPSVQELETVLELGQRIFDSAEF